MEELQAKQIRDSRLDLIRSLALLMIITVHTWSLGRVTTFPMIAAVYHAFADCGVPLFVMVSGALMLGRPINDLRKFYSHRFLRILVPFFIWSLVVYVLSALLGKYDDVHSVLDAVTAYIPRLMENRINEAYWFVQMILLLYVLTPILRWTIERLSMQQLGVVCLIWWQSVALCDVFADWYLVKEYTSHTLVYAGYYVLGYYLYRQAQHACKYRYWFLVPTIVGCGLCLYFYPQQAYCLRALLVAGLFAWLCRCPQREIKPLRMVSDCSYTVYLMHMMTIAPIYMILRFGPDANAWQCAIIPIATTLLVAAICLAICYAIRLVMKKNAWWLGIR